MTTSEDLDQVIDQFKKDLANHRFLYRIIEDDDIYEFHQVEFGEFCVGMCDFLEALKKKYEGTTMTEYDLVFTHVDYEIDENDIDDPSSAYVRIQFTPDEDLFNWAKGNECNAKSLVETILKEGVNWVPDHFLFDVIVEELVDESEGYTGAVSGKLDLEEIIKLK